MPNNKPFKVLDEHIYFNNAHEAHMYARSNPGKVVTRNSEFNELVNSSKKVIIKEPKMKISPKMILDHLNKHVISQDEAKKEIALAMYYHSLKSEYETNKDIGTNGPVMIVGPTGSGKTFIVQKACEFIDTLFIHVDTSSMVPEGIKGYSISSLVDEILEKSDYNIDKASHCVVFFDEMDKLFHGDDASEYGPKVASQLLRLIEGAKVPLSNGVLEKIFRKEEIDELDTSNIQFILGGAFQWILDTKTKHKVSMGFKSNVELIKYEVTLQDLYEVGVPKEFLGRMNSIVNLHKLSAKDYFKILKESSSSPLNEFVKKIEFHGDAVKIDNETLMQVSNEVAKNELGVRAMKQILKSMFSEALFSAADGEYKTHNITYM